MRHRLLPLIFGPATVLLLGANVSARAAQQPSPPPATPSSGTASPVPPAGAPNSPFVSPFVTPTPPPGTPDSLLTIPADYRIDIGDAVSVSTPPPWNINATVSVPVDGMLRLPRLKAPVYARLRTCTELAEALRLAWSHQLKIKPGQVTVGIAAMRARRVLVQGNGAANGEVALQPGWRIANLVATLGGNPFPERLTVTITNPARSAPVKVDLAAAVQSPDGPENAALLEGDTITILQPKTIRLLIEGEGPRGMHNVDARFGLRRALTQLAFSPVNAPGALRDAKILRPAVDGDPNSEAQFVPVDLYAVMTSDDPKDFPLRDMDLLYIPPSRRQVYVFGEIAGRGLLQLREDRGHIYLMDVLAQAGTPLRDQSNIKNILIRRYVDGKPVDITANWDAYIKRQDPSGNPEIFSQDLIYVFGARDRNRTISNIFNGAALVNLFRSFIPIFGR